MRSTSLLILFASVLWVSCTYETVEPDPNVQAPYHLYRFERDGLNTVVNTGQIVRGALIEDILIFIERLAEPGAQPVTYDDLYRYFDNEGMTIPGAPLLPVALPLDPPHLVNISGNRDLETRVGAFRDHIVSSIQEWCTKLAANCLDPGKLGQYTVYIDPETGFDLAVMYQLTGLGGANLSHGLHGYFRNVHKKENDKLVAWGPDTLIYTEMEHHWDESYGYFGAAHNQYDFQVEEVADRANGRHYKDNYEKDGTIDLRNEYNFSFAVNAAKRDVSSATGTQFLRTIYESFYQGRRAIVNKQYDSLLIHKDIILDNWEKSIAATAIHHLNGTYTILGEMADGSGMTPDDFFRHWSAMFKYIEMLRYNYANRFTEWEAVLSEMLTDQEVPYPKVLVSEVQKIPGYRERLLMVRQMLQETYEFTDSDVATW